LFDTLEKLKSNDSNMDLERAKTIVNVSDAIINTAKVELQFLKDVGNGSMPDLIDATETAHFLQQENDPRVNPHLVKRGLGTGKHLGSL
jgi:hypothetical protein